MNIVLFDDLPEGGAKRVVFEQVKRLSENHVVDYVTNTLPTQFPLAKFAHEVYRFDLDLSINRGWRRLLQELSYYTKIKPTYDRIADLINQIDPDCVIVHPSRLCECPPLLNQLTSPTIYFAEEWLRVVYEPDLEPWPESRTKRWYEQGRRAWIRRLDRQAVKAAGKVVVTSTYMQHMFLQAYQKKSVVIPPGVDPVIFHPDQTKTPPKYFLFVGEPVAANGYDLIHAVEQQFGLPLPVTAVGFKQQRFRYSDRQLAGLYQHATATLCLGRREPFGLTALESMACGTPVIAIDEGGYRDTVSHKRTGLLIPRQASALFEAMSQLKQNDDLRQRLGSAGPAKVAHHFTWEQHILRLEKIMPEK